jgi:hypothetical protein
MFNNSLFHTTVNPSFTKSLEINLITESGFGQNKKRIKTDNIDLTALKNEELCLVTVLIENTANKEIATLNYLNNELENSRKFYKTVQNKEKGNELYLMYLQRIKTKEQKILLLEECLDYCMSKKGIVCEEYTED